MERRLNGKQQTFLDVFRIMASLFVMIGHGLSFFQLTVIKDETYFPYIQNIGVVMLFLLAGFLSAYSINIKNSRHDYKFSQYFIHKSTRILRELFPGLIIIAVIDFISIRINGVHYAYFDAFNIKQFVGNLLMLENMGPYGFLSNWFIPFGSGRPLWTLSLEWWMYMLFGFVFLVIANKEKINIPKGIVFIAIVSMISEYLITGRGGGLGFVFLLGIFTYYLIDRIELYTAALLLPLSMIVYYYFGTTIKSAYKVYSFLLLWVLFVSALKVCGGVLRKERETEFLPLLQRERLCCI